MCMPPTDIPDPPEPAPWPDPPEPQDWDVPLFEVDAPGQAMDNATFTAWLDQNSDVKDWVRDGGVLNRPPVGLEDGGGVRRVVGT